MNDIILILFFFTFIAMSLRNIRHGIYAVIFSMPLYLIRFSVGGIPTTALEIMIYILFLVWVSIKIRKLLYRNFYSALAEGFSGFNRLYKNNFILSIGIALLFLGLIVSTFYSSDSKTSLGIFKGWFADPFLFFIVFISVIKKEKHIDLVLTSWLFSGIIVSLVSLYYLYTGELTFDGRLHAFYLSPNHLAMYISPIFLIILFFLLNRRSLDRKVFRIQYLPVGRQGLVLNIFLLIIFVPLYFTYSYGAFLGIFAGVVYLLAVGNKNNKKNKLNLVAHTQDVLSFLRGFSRRLRSFRPIVFQSDWRLKSGRIQLLKFLHDKLLLIIFLSLIFTSFIFISSNKFDQIINSDNRSSFHSRLMIWNSAGEIIKDNPIFGIGPGTFQKTYLSYAEKFNEPYLEWAVPQPHNIFLAFYLQTGFIGFIGFILILSWFFKYNRFGNEAMPRCYGFIIVLMIYILIHGLVDTTYWKNDLSLMFWLIIGMAVIESNKINKLK